MYASSTGPRSALRRRGIVLVLVLGMLGLMALIGVTFATFAGQSLKNGRNFSQGLGRPQPEALMDYALAQLINDTNNPLSAIRGHSLLRDMYGNDSVYRGSNPPANSVAETGGLLSSIYDRTLNGGSGGYSTLHLTALVGLHPTGSTATPFYNQVQYLTNIPTNGPYSGYDFTRWIMRFPGFTTTGAPAAYVPQTFEVLEDDYSGAYHLFTLSANLGNPTTNDKSYTSDATNNGSSANVPAYSSSDWTSFLYYNPNIGANLNGTSVSKNYTHLLGEFNTAGQLGISNPFVLDGRYMRAFNGPGLTRPATPAVNSSGALVNAYPYNQAAYGNMRIAGIDPDAIGMDEDYDACDLENWFLAIQSADGQVMIPSFHRPGILTGPSIGATSPLNDWYSSNAAQRAKILRPRQIDNSPLFPADPSVLDSHGKLTYDIDNDGDGVTDSVWLDLGYPTQRDPNGKLYKPLFAFMVLGLNGRLPLNTVGNLQARAIGTTNATITAAGETPDTVMYPSSTAQVPYPGVYTYNSMSGPNHHPNLSSQVFFDTPLYDHASHLGYSVNEINPKFALQNAPANLYPSTNGYSQTAYGVYTDITSPFSFTQYDDAGVSVALTQLRNILAGTIDTNIANPYTGTLPIASNMPSTSTNYDVNIVYVNGSPFVFPNGVADNSDLNQGGYVYRLAPRTPGRWGETQGIPNALPYPATVDLALFDPTFPIAHYTNSVRAGRSYYIAGATTNDAMDDNYNAFDPFLTGGTTYAGPNVTFNLTNPTSGTTGNPLSIPLPNAPTGYAGSPFTRVVPEAVDAFDAAGQMAVAAERSRRFVVPHDPAGVGRMVDYMNRPNSENDFGKGADSHGRASFFRYFRPAGMPQEIIYPYTDAGVAPATDFNYAYATNSGTGQRYLMPVLLPAGQSSTSGIVPAVTPDVANNKLHGYQAMATPDTQGAVTADKIATMAAMPFDWDPATGQYPNGYPDTISLYCPTINPNQVPQLLSNVNSEVGPNVGGTIATSSYPIPYVPPFDGSGNYSAGYPSGPMVVNGYIGGSLNKDEAAEMNLYSASTADMPYGPTDLEWLYRKHDVDGATLNSRLAQLAPISFLNPADGLTRRRMFSTDSWELINFSYANDNPIPYAGTLGGNSTFANIHSSDHDFTYNSRFMPNASPSLELMNQVVDVTASDARFVQFANPVTTEFLPNPTLPTHTLAGGSIFSYIQNSSYIGSPIGLPLGINNAQPNTAASPYNMYGAAFINAAVNTYTNVIITQNTNTSAAQVPTPSVAHRDRKINLNFPLPISNDPAEPVRQKWCRETYQLLKAILPPASVDTPEELAALSQFVVNIIDFRDTDCSMTRFVNTDLVATDTLSKVSQPTPPATGYTSFDTTWNVSPMGVRFARPELYPTDALPAGNFPYDPSLYSPDVATPFLVQHGMEYNPIAINEVFALQYDYSKTNGALDGTARGLFIELVNTLSESQSDSRDGRDSVSTLGNSSTVDLTGWDLIITPDYYGWGRPDPISGDVPVVAWPPLPAGTTLTDPTVQGQASGNTQSPVTTAGAPTPLVQQYRFTTAATTVTPNPANNKVRALNGNNIGDYYIVGAYSTGITPPASGAGLLAPPGGASLPVESNAMISPTATSGNRNDGTTTPPVLDVLLPQSFVPASTDVTDRSGNGAYYWVYLRRPANPFDTADLSSTATPPRINREMVVVDAMRFPFIDAKSSSTGTASTTPLFSAQRLQPYRGGHLVPEATIPKANGTVEGTTVTTISPPSPASAYGYSEQTSPPTSGTDYAKFVRMDGTVQHATSNFLETIGAQNNPKDTNWALFPFHDRDFTSVTELLLVPGCPPGLFTKQFAEEPYPGHAAQGGTSATSGKTPPTSTPPGGSPATYKAAFGWDYSSLTGNTAAPTNLDIGRVDFGYNGAGGSLPAAPTFPYLTDNFYYTAASVAPPISSPTASVTLGTSYTQLTTEIGGWTGTGWHKMMEFFEVPSSANGAIGTADGGNNYDWARNDLKPGLLNLNLLIDEEVFAGLIDDPRLNENLAVQFPPVVGATMPYVVSQIDGNGFPASVDNGNGTATVLGQYPIFPLSSTSLNVGAGGTPLNPPNGTPTGRGYVLRDPNVNNYAAGPPYAFQQLHGIKAAFSDFLKLRHGGSGYLFAHGGGDVSMGSFGLLVSTNVPTQPIAADRPYRSLSYPDINYTIMRPATLPPSPADTVNPTPQFPGTIPPLPPILLETSPNGSIASPYGQASLYGASPSGGLFIYGAATGTTPPSPYVTLSPTLAPAAGSPASSYIQDPGIRNPFLDIQFNNTDAETSATATIRRLAPPYDTHPVPATLPTPAPFPPTIPPTPARRLFQVPDFDMTSYPTSNASRATQQNASGGIYVVNEPVTTPQLWSASVATNSTPPTGSVVPAPPTLIAPSRAVFLADNYTPQAATAATNYLGAGATTSPYDLRQHPAYRTEWLQKISNLTTVRTHQFAVWITVGFFEVVKTGTPELGIPDVLGQELSAGAGRTTRYRSFFVIDRTKATGFNPYYPGNFRDCVTYRRRIE